MPIETVSAKINNDLLWKTKKLYADAMARSHETRVFVN